MTDRESIRARTLRLASAAVLKDRNKAYGNPKDNFIRIAREWNTWLQNRYGELLRHDGSLVRLDTFDVAIMSQKIKLARLSTNPTHEDSHTDNTGYAACAAECALLPEEAEKEKGCSSLASSPLSSSSSTSSPPPSTSGTPIGGEQSTGSPPPSSPPQSPSKE